MLYCVIMAGGSGTRLWPLSRRKSPKQAIPIAQGQSLFERTVARLDGLISPEKTFVITSAEIVRTLVRMAPRIPKNNFIAEPCGRDSAAAAFLGASIVVRKDPDACVFVVSADHVISPVDRLHDAVRKAARLAGEGYLVTFGIPATYPSTAYGYVERGARIRGVSGAFRVKRFHEKPDPKTARRYLRAKRFFWNSGLFVWKAAAILDAARLFAPDHFRALDPLGALVGRPSFEPRLAAAYRDLQRISIDYAVMEKADNVAMVRADFQWSDVGGPVALRTCMKADEAGNIHLGLVDLLDSRNCVAISGDDRLLAVFGCTDLVVIQTPDATLVCPAERAEELKRLVSRLESRPDTHRFL